MIAALAAIGLGLVIVSIHSTPRAAGHNNIDADAPIKTVDGGSRFCQNAETIPEDTHEIRVSLSAPAPPGPAIAVHATRGGRPITSGRLASGWSGDSVTIPVRAVDAATGDARVCFATRGEETTLYGSSHKTIGDNYTRGPAPVDDRPIGERFRIDYMRGGSETLLSRLPAVIRRWGLNAAVRGPWAALLAVALMLGVIVLVTVRLLRDLDERRAVTVGDEPEPPSPASRLASRTPSIIRKVPPTGLICALVATLNVATWALVSPPFQFLDEQDHFAYVQHMAESGKPPTDRTFRFSQEVSLALHDLRYLTVRTRGDNVPLWSDQERDRLDRVLARPLSRTDRQGVGTAIGQPPLAYALGAVPYKAASGASLLQRLTLIRLLSALLAGVTALFAFLFVREALPRVPWAWTVAGLGVALQPTFASASAAVNPDALLFAVSAALFYCIARAFRRGLTPHLAVATGLLLASGLLTKLSFAGLVPGALVAIVAVAIRAAPRRNPASLLTALRLPVVVAVSALAPLLLVAVLNATAWNQPTLGVATIGSDLATAPSAQDSSPRRALDVIWQLYLPRLDGMSEDIPSSSLPLKTVWLDGFVGSFGWATIKLPSWVTTLAALAALLALGLCGMALGRAVREVRKRGLELAAYAVMVLGMLVTIGYVQYSSVALGSSAWFGQSRYLLPLLAPFAAVLALAARGAGMRWGPSVGALIVTTVLAHLIFSQLLTISTYYV